MKLTGHGNAVAIALAGLAVVLAATGTAYAVTTTTVNIADPTTPTHIANVDSSGHLLTAGSLSTIDSAGYLTGYQYQESTFILSPTTASIALTRIRLDNPGRNTTQQQLAVDKTTVDSSGNCTTTVTQLLGSYDLQPGQESIDPFAQPLVVKATAGAKYCLAVYVASSDTTPGYYLSYSVTAYVASGTYTGIGIGATPGGIVARSPKIAH